MNRRSFFGALAGLPLAGCASMPTEEGRKFIDSAISRAKVMVCPDKLKCDIVYRTNGLWGRGKGMDLSAAEVDMNFYHLSNRLVEIEEALAKPRYYLDRHGWQEWLAPPLLPRKDQL